MKYILSLGLIFLCLSIYSQNSFETPPPGTIKINDSLFIDNIPVDNLMYKEFAASAERSWNMEIHDSLQSLELDEMNMKILNSLSSKTNNKSLFEKVSKSEELHLPEGILTFEYFNLSQYSNNPVIGISKEQAALFCKWRTDMVNLRFNELNNQKKTNYKKIAYRLPKNEDYKLAKSEFSANGKFLKLAGRTPLEIDLDDFRKTQKFVMTKYPEYTSDKNSETQDYTLFRCICEVEE
ncbi:SUMF1/EgtB/PvdO family nonheme iron enzyme [Christiangramia sp. SM2212]|uniref:SUMF1/EgtB/PvdO family nonheme iron enzyme n=1 Tax=Christiangramia sediminicola TaxID=3073267 RepID=A0ABU1ELE2_9FLAO|nr:SUMF1/EgtB/PvdO family nonheme iron enzyme [Christiangramia sp. SM2212]MDR5589078.1 SUMF1/EgtB/PvdO family nonheme iron enzyme [Christiangramia sp. SM2212]